MEESQSTKNKRIAKNTIYLYLRTFVVMAISLFTSRVILRALGEIDFGIYNLVGGLVIFFTFINSAMTASTQRFLNYEVGQDNPKSITHIFSTSLMIHIYIAGAIFILAETIGLWFLIEKLNIPADRRTAAFWVYQFTVLTTCLNTIRCPHNASIIAFERMDFFARISILEAVFKLTIAFFVLYSPTDKLILYAALLFVSTVIINLVYKNYCNRNFEEIHFRYKKDSETMKKMLGFSLWSLLGNGSLMASNQGISMMLNMFYSVIVNAALGIANQVNMVASTMVSNFQTAFMPQITKSYANGEVDYLNKLIFTTSRYSFLLLFLIAYPIYLNCDTILTLWLGEYPEYTTGLVRIILLCMVFDALCGPLWMTVHARGNIRNYQIVVSILLLLTLPVCFIAIKSGLSPILAYGTRLVILLAIYLFRVCYIKLSFGLGLRKYIRCTLLPILVIIISGVIISVLLKYFQLNRYLKLIIDVVMAILLITLLGLTKSERVTFIASIRQRLK